jgi:hypothetical protein
MSLRALRCGVHAFRLCFTVTCALMCGHPFWSCVFLLQKKLRAERDRARKLTKRVQKQKEMIAALMKANLEKDVDVPDEGLADEIDVVVNEAITRAEAGDPNVLADPNMQVAKEFGLLEVIKEMLKYNMSDLQGKARWYTEEYLVFARSLLDVLVGATLQTAGWRISF